MECQKCVYKKDCWIKATMESKKGFTMPSDAKAQDIVIRASYGDCPFFDDGEE